MNRRDAAADRRKRMAITNITAHEPIENSSNPPRTAFPTHPVCRNDVQSCTAVKLTRSRGVAESRRNASLRGDQFFFHQALCFEVEAHIIRRHRVQQASPGAARRAEV